MGNSATIGIIALTVLGAAILVYAFQSSKSKPTDRRKGSRRKQKGRRTRDKLPLNRQERKIQKEAHHLIQQGKVREGAKMLESINDFREAISTLENNGFPIEASHILLRMGIPNRAGVVLARNQRWTEAAEAFVSAKMDREAAKCYYNAKQFPEAARLFTMIKDHESAADAHIKNRSYLEGVKSYFMADQPGKAIKVLRTLGEKSASGRPDPLGKKIELTLLNHMKTTEFHDDIVRWFTDDSVLHQALPLLMSEGKIKLISEILSSKDENFALKVMQDAPQETHIGQNLAMAFEESEYWQLAGMIFERIGQFEKAGECFEKKGDLTRANYCFDRAGTPKRKAKPVSPASEFESEGQATAILDTGNPETAGQPKSPPSPPSQSDNSQNMPGRFSLDQASVVDSNLSHHETKNRFHSSNRFFNTFSKVESNLFQKLCNDFVISAQEDLSHRLTHHLILVLEGKLTVEIDQKRFVLDPNSFIGNIPTCMETFTSNTILLSESEGKVATIGREPLGELMATHTELSVKIIRNAFQEFCLLHADSSEPSLNLVG